MTDRNIFMETLHEVAEIVRTSAEAMSRDEILFYFKDMDLTKEQENMVIEYLLTPHDEEAAEEPEEPQAVEPSKAEPQELTDSRVFQMYMEDIERLPSYTEDEIRMSYINLLSGREDAIDKITAFWYGRIVEMAKNMFNGAVNFEDVVQEGNVALFVKLKELLGTKQAVDVEEELSDSISSAMKSYISEITGEEDGEETIAGKANLVNEAVKYLEEHNGTIPDKNEIAEFTHLTMEELSDIMDIMKKAEKKGK